MRPHEERVVEEYKDLSAKIEKLGAFINTNPTFHELGEGERLRLTKQFGIMLQYQQVLQERIQHFPSA